MSHGPCHAAKRGVRAALCLLAASAALGADAWQGLRETIRARLAETSVASLSVALARDGKIVWEEGFGWADREKRVAASEHTLYSLASISKPVTATGLMILVERGQLDLDKPIDYYLGSAKVRARTGDARQATVRRVANHSAGLPLHYQFFYADEPYRRPSMDETILRYANLVWPPGERFQYSNLGFGLLDYVIARVSGVPYDEFMRREVFVPMGLARMSVHLTGALEPYAATRYAPDGSRIPFYDFDHPGASALWASAHDLVRFAMFHLKATVEGQKRILKNSSIDEMQRPTMRATGDAQYGVAWRISETPSGHRIVSHTGGMGGVSTSLRLLPAERVALAVLCNGSSLLPHTISDRILESVVAGFKPAAGPSNPGRGEFRPPESIQGRWRGALSTYQKDLPLTLEIFANGDVHAQLTGQLKTLLNHARFQDGVLTGSMTGDIGTEDANRRPYTLQMNLIHRSEILNGAASATSLPGARAGNALTQWVELKRENPHPTSITPRR